MALRGSRWLCGAALALPLLATACASSQPTRFYTLAPITEPGSKPVERTRDLLVEVGPVSLPAYLDRTQIVTRLTPTRVDLSDTHSWVEPLDGLAARTVAESLSVILGSDQVLLWPQQGDVAADYRLEMQVLRFDTDEAGKALLDARWLLFDADGTEPVAVRRERIEEQAQEPAGYEERVAAMSRALALLSRRVAEEVARRTR
ncbi:PqiC family protein [Geminicoccaceae bacterium 1502E]|nr:PqiC family protein [Geminicoccaceae bacterium 1502E]